MPFDNPFLEYDDPNQKALANPRVRTFLDKIGKSEGADYNTLVGGRKIKDLSRHPNVVGLRTSAGPSTAFGKYQIVGTTDRTKLAKYRHLDYSPENQDLRAVELLRQTKALDALEQGDERTAIKRAGREWASLPGSSLPGRKRADVFQQSPQNPFLEPQKPSPQVYETKLTSAEERQFQAWKRQYASKDSGADYDLRGAFKSGLKPDARTGHWPDTFKKPNHPTFSNESRYATGENAARAGRWEGNTFVSPQTSDTSANPFLETATAQEPSTPDVSQDIGRGAAMARARPMSGARPSGRFPVTGPVKPKSRWEGLAGGVEGESPFTLPKTGGEPVLQMPHQAARKAAQRQQTQVEQLVNQESQRTVFPGDPSLEQRINARLGAAPPQVSEEEKYALLRRLGLDHGQVKAIGVRADKGPQGLTVADYDRMPAPSLNIIPKSWEAVKETVGELPRAAQEGVSVGFPKFYAAYANLFTAGDRIKFFSNVRDAWLQIAAENEEPIARARQEERFRRMIAGEEVDPNMLQENLGGLGAAGPAITKFAVVKTLFGAAGVELSEPALFGLVSAIDNNDKPALEQVKEMGKNVLTGYALKGLGQVGAKLPPVTQRAVQGTGLATVFGGMAALEGQPVAPAVTSGLALGIGLGGGGRKAKPEGTRGAQDEAITQNITPSRGAIPEAQTDVATAERAAISSGRPVIRGVDQTGQSTASPETQPNEGTAAANQPQPEIPAQPIRHVDLQSRRARNTESGTKGQFKPESKPVAEARRAQVQGVSATQQPQKPAVEPTAVIPERAAQPVSTETTASTPAEATPPAAVPVAKEPQSVLDKRPWEVALKELEGRWTREQHREDVEAAIKQGFDVPAPVQAEYPDLFPKASAAAAPASTVEEAKGQISEVSTAIPSTTAARSSGAETVSSNAPKPQQPPVAPQGQAEGVKEPWKMTRGEFLNDRIGKREEGVTSYGSDTRSATRQILERGFRADHEKMVARALREGKPVPPEVLADYPDLAPPSQVESTAKDLGRDVVAPRTLKEAQDMASAEGFRITRRGSIPYWTKLINEARAAKGESAPTKAATGLRQQHDDLVAESDRLYAEANKTQDSTKMAEAHRLAAEAGKITEQLPEAEQQEIKAAALQSMAEGFVRGLGRKAATPELPKNIKGIKGLPREWKLSKHSRTAFEVYKGGEKVDTLIATGDGRWRVANKGDLGRFAAPQDAVTALAKSPLSKQAGAIDVDLLTLGVRPFAREAVEKGRSGVRGVREVIDGMKSLLAPATRGPQARTTAAITRANASEMARAHDIAERSLAGAQKYFASQKPESNYDFIDRMEQGQRQVDPKTQNFADTLRSSLDERRDQIRALGTGKLENFIEDYFPHIWKDPIKAKDAFAQAFGRRPLEGSKAFLKQRKIPLTREGLDYGLKPVSDNPVDLAILKMREMDKYLMAHKIMGEMKENGLLQFIKSSERVPDGYAKIDDRVATVYGPPKGGTVIRGQYVAPEPAAKILNNYLSPGIEGTALRVPFKAWRASANILNQAQLGWSAYHAGFTTLDAAISRTAVGLEDIFRHGKPVKGLAAIASTPVSPITNLIKGSRMLREWYAPGSQGAEVGKMVDAMVQGGGRAKMDQFYMNNATKRFMDTLKQGNLIGAALRLPHAAIETASAPIMQWLVPRQKAGIFAEMAKREIERLGPDASREQVREAMAKAWDSVDNRMGQMVYDNVFWSKVTKDLAMASVRSVGWNLGTLREVGGGIADYATLPKRALQRGRTDPLFTHKMAYATALPLVVGTIGAMTQYLMTGKGPDELKDYFFPKTGLEDENGNPERIAFPSYMKDIFHFKEEPGRVITAKAHPLISLTGEMLSNSDYYGTKIRNEDDPLVQQVKDAAEHIGKSFIPFSVRGYQKETERGGSLAKRALPFVGIVPAPSYINKSDADKLMSERLRAQMPKGTRTKEEAERSQLRYQFQRRLRRGEDVTNEINKEIRVGNLKPADAQAIPRDAQQSPSELRFKRLGVEDALDVYGKMSLVEREKVKDVMTKKRDLIDRLPVTEQDAVRERFEKLGLQPPQGQPKKLQPLKKLKPLASASPTILHNPPRYARNGPLWERV